MKSPLILVIFCGLVSGTVVAADKPLSDAEIRQILIQQSLASYPGNCPCPYNVMKNGRSCGKRSAYSKPGGYSPLCYPADVSDTMVENYRKKHSR
ncbi:hypothetical protein [Kordiimonas aestuarii]|uniref:hypothetical protein n=1 Tax=Kordiimonas aestuarii TaxID=1005925 RepID=UPI00374DF57E